MSWLVGPLIALAAFAGQANASMKRPVVPAPRTDEEAVRAADDAFWRAFNACDAAAMANYFSRDIEFYHDLTGLTRTRAAVVASLVKGPCGTPGLHLRRELVPGSVRYQAVPGYGAVLTGDHLFYAREGTAPEHPTTLARFLVIWKRESDRWAMTRIVSYDHRPAPYHPSSTPIPIRKLLDLPRTSRKHADTHQEGQRAKPHPIG